MSFALIQAGKTRQLYSGAASLGRYKHAIRRGRALRGNIDAISGNEIDSNHRKRLSMDFEDTPEEAEFRVEVTSWLDSNAEKKSDETDATAELFEERDEDKIISEARVWQAKKADAGWACIRWPEEYGGRSATPIQQVIWNQEVSKYHAPEGIFTIGQGMGGPTVITHGTPDQKEKWLRPLLRGEEIWCQLFSEPAAGSDAAGITTRAVRDGDEFVVNGQKVWTSGAHYSKWGMLTTRTDLDAPKHKGMTYFIVDMEAPGVTVKPLRQMTGGANFNEVFFDDVRIPAWNVMGEINDGWRVAMTTLMNERVAIGGGGGGSGGVRALYDLARKSRALGGPGNQDPEIRQDLMKLTTIANIMKYTSFRTLTSISKGGIPGPEGSIGKLLLVKFLADQADVAERLSGAAGMCAGSDAPDQGRWVQSLLAYPGMKIAGGTDEILKNIVGERVLGLPREPRVDKEVAFKDIPQGTMAKV